MYIAWNNRADGASITAGSQVTTLPATNVQDPHIARKWYSVSGVNSTYAIFDMGSSVACALAAILGTNLTSAATVQIRASDADPTVIGTLLRDTGVIAAGVKNGYGAIYKAFATATARYWRIDLADASLTQLKIGRVFLGPYWAPTAGQLWDWGVEPLDPSVRSRSKGGQSWFGRRAQRRQLQFILDYMDEAEMYGNSFALARDNGVVTDVLAIPSISSAYLSEQAVWGTLERSEPLVRRSVRVFRHKYTIDERQ